MEPEISSYLETQGEIPSEIWGQLDEQTRNVIAEGVKYIALTFDDGPRCETTSALLDGLKERGAQATFFVIGSQVMCAGNEGLLERMTAEGHQVGNHTYSHEKLLDAEISRVIEEIHKNEIILKKILGEGEFWLRPPYGLIDSTRAKLLETPMIYWSLDPEDWKWLDAKKVTELVTSSVKAGDIILLHDFYPSSVEAALAIIDRLQPLGYVFVTVEELFAIYGTEPENGVLYASPEQIRQIP
ncbi:MAG: polysaccharide deacetylase family protein [Oscillospiraceae bacterium]|nr:polysaccharide deacetylase family protein [Oscillospiraceae bacterium]